MAAVVPATVFVYEVNPAYLSEVTDYIAGGAILAGQIVSFAGTGVAWTVHPANGVTTAAVAGVALHGAATGAHVAVAGPGSVVKVQNGDDTTTLDAGDMVAADVTSAFGCAIAIADATKHYQVGVMLEDTVGSAQGYCLLTGGNVVTKGE
jgi:hypothetical protein